MRCWRPLPGAPPTGCSRNGVGPYTAATLMVVAGRTPKPSQRCGTGSSLRRKALLHISGSAAHRLNRGGSREANNALWTIAMVRMRSDARTRAYVARRTAEGLSPKEIQRCLKRYIVRELYPLILADLRDAIRGFLT